MRLNREYSVEVTAVLKKLKSLYEYVPSNLIYYFHALDLTVNK